MKKFFLSLAVFVIAICANAQKNQYFWYQGNLMMGNPIAQIDSVTFGEGEPVDTLHILLPRTIIKTVEVHDTTIVAIHDTTIIHDTIFLNCPVEGALTGEFSISPTNKISFSKGNLQYQASTDTWRFAENQYDIIGSANENISSSYTGWIDLFGWGTGNNPTASSMDNADYYAFTDWGVNRISNGGNISDIWRTLTTEEWGYLCNSRLNANNLIGHATVNDIHGIIILPDLWTTPSSISWQGLPYNWTTNQYSTEEWKKMEAKGAVFLPVAGDREGITVLNFNNYGFYWSASFPQSSNYSYCDANNISFTSTTLIPTGIMSPRRTGMSVRLVRNIE